MENIYPMLIAFFMIFVSELGDKTQILVMSFSGKQKIATILLGVALGTFFSHGLAILFGSYIGAINNENVKLILDFATNIIFIIFGLIFLFNKEKEESDENKTGLLSKLANIKLNYILIIAISIAVGELGDKTFLAAIGLGIQYAKYKIPLVIGAIMGMVISDLLAIILGKIISKKIPEELMKRISGILFIIFGIIGILLK